MYLTRVEAQGFKSFADRQRFDFGPGITAIVGPNGSGKSNVSDAIRWALGEAGARAIRARKTEDVIFHGSDGRKPVGVAEVTLTLDNAEGWMPLDFAEVSVTRRAFRSGENEYLINGKRVRLLDVQDLFRRAQVGQNSYAMMTQGMVDRVLSMRPAERRELIEEAAHVAQHRVELNRAERRLLQTRDNLGHVRVLIQEVEPRIRQLERQSARARRYRELDRALSEALQVYFDLELRQAHETLTAARAQHDQRAQALAAVRGELVTVERALADASERATARRAALDACQAEERRRSEEVLRLEQAVALGEQRLELLRQRAADLDAELTLLQSADGPESAGSPSTAEPGGDPAAAIQRQIAGLDARAAEAAASLTRERDALRAADDAAREALRALNEAEARRTRLDAERADLVRRIEDLRAETSRLADERTAALERRAALQAELRDYGRRALDQRRNATRLAAETNLARRQRDEAETRLEEAQQYRQQLRDALQGARNEVEQLQAHAALLASLDDGGGDPGSAAAALIEASQAEDTASPEPPLEGVVDVLSRLLRVPDGLEAAIEAALAEHLSAVVVERADDAFAAVAYLREHAAGATTIYPLDSVVHNYPLNLFNERGVIGVAARLVRVDREYRPLIDTLLGRTIVVDTLDTARRMVQRGLGSVVTRDGVLLRPNGAVYGGRIGRGAEQFRMRRELEELPPAIAEAEQRAAQAESALARVEEAVAEQQRRVANARAQVDEADRRRAREEREAASRLQATRTALASRMRVVHEALRADIEATPRRLAAVQDRLAALDEERAAVTAQIAELQDRASAVAAERDGAEARATAATRALATAEAERDAARAQAREREARRRRVEQQIAERRDLLAATRREIEDVDGRVREQRTDLGRERVALTAAREAVAPEHAALAEAQAAEREHAIARGDLQTRLLAVERELLESDAALREAAQRLQSLQRELADAGLEQRGDGSIGPLAASSEGSAVIAEGDRAARSEFDPPDGPSAADGDLLPIPIRGGAEVDATALRDRISELRAQIRALGPVNLEAVDDLTEERERYEFLATQVQDLEAAEVELRKAIRELRKRIRTRFDETFEQVNTGFGDYFARFFGGGTARLVIVEPEEGDEDAEAGVEIEARPPGKRVAQLAQLSGGERSMTSVALLFSLLAVNPAPVCVLDEVDAALDEANVGRFVGTLREMAERTQFVVITHNRATVEAANAIYGVSMGEDSTSRVLSLQLEAVEELPRAS